MYAENPLPDLSQRIVAELLLLLEQEGFSPELILPDTRLEQLELSSIQLMRLKVGLELALGHPLHPQPLPLDTLSAFIDALATQEARHQGLFHPPNQPG